MHSCKSCSNNDCKRTCLKIPCVDITQKDPTGKKCLVLNKEDKKLYYSDCSPEWQGPLAIETPPTPAPLPIEGYWINTSLVHANLQPPLLFFSRDEAGDIICKVFAGTVKNIRELTNEDIQNSQFLLDFSRDSSYCYTIDNNPNRLSLVYPQDEQVFGPDWQFYTFAVQDDLETGVFQSFDYTSFANDQGLCIYKKIEANLLPPIQKWGAPSIGPNYTNPVDIFEYVFNVMYLNGNAQITKSFNTYSFPGLAKYTEIKNKIRDEGILWNSSLTNILKTGSTIIPNFGALTTIYTFEDHGANVGSVVKISGLKGDYAVCNGTWDVSAAQINRDSVNKLPPGFVNPKSKVNMFNISLDTSNVSETYNPQKHGYGLVEIRNGPVKPTTEYRELVAALGELNSQLGGPGTHARGNVAAKTSQVLKTFADVQNELNVKSKGAVFNIQMRNRLMPRNGSSFISQNLYLALFGMNNNTIFRNTLANDPFGIYPESGNIYDYNIVQNNYLEPGSFRNIYWKVVYHPDDIVYPLNNFLTGFDYPTNGTRFEFIVSETDPGGDYVIGSTNGIYDRLNDPNYPSPSTQVDFYCGIIRSEFTNGEKVGYIRLILMFALDGPWYLSGEQAFWDAESQAAGLPNFQNNTIKAYATMVQYLNEAGCTRIIYDNRGNGGGNTFLALATCFGGERNVGNSVNVGNNDGFGPFKKYQDLVSVNGYQTAAQNWQSRIDAIETVYPERINVVIPNGQFVNGEVTFLTSVDSSSGGDIVSRQFLGNGGNSLDIGENVTVKFVGDIDGRNTGATTSINVYPSLKDAQGLTDSAGNNVSVWQQNAEIPSSQFVEENGTYAGNPNYTMKPEILVDYSFENTTWTDLGFINPGNYPGGGSRVDNSVFTQPGQNGGNPDPTIQTSWRDTALEAAIVNQ